LYVHPLLAGIDPSIGRETLRLLRERVLPALRDSD
jgi:hypothetical protein